MTPSTIAPRWRSAGHRTGPRPAPAHDEAAAILGPVTGQRAARRPGRDAAGLQIRIEGPGLQTRIEASGLPGRDWYPDGGTARQNIHVAVQPRDSHCGLLGVQPGDAATAVWAFTATSVPARAGIDLTGPYIQGRPGGRFIYLSWGTVDRTGAFAMFRRAKLMLDGADQATLGAARRYGRLIGRLGLTDAQGGPLCAAVRPPLISWSASSAG